ncbi:putative nuclear speckle splicing regulatory protein 1 like protein [Phyllosticta capitalensis]|uniref:Nuclear speckle splicing regulatory protein 1 like protein n=1 Tax=Phyllosticta capitalensis TaxID=121624 RepID=A0ABR1YU37_9PEZI
MSLQYGLNIKKKPGQAPSRAKPKALFGDDDSDKEESAKNDNVEEIGAFDLDASSQASSARLKPRPKEGTSKQPSKPRISPYGDLSSQRSQRKQQEEAEALDPSIYDYDAAYDALHANDAAKKAKDREEAALRKPKYMESLLASAEVRKRDQLRAKEKVLQREREAEGDTFADKEKFVTEAYKKQQEELLKLEEEEKRKEEAQRKKAGPGMSGFYKSMMDEQEKKHQETIEAAERAKNGGLEVSAEEELKHKSDAELAKEMKEKGVDVMINDEGQVADKRQLLTAGLNVAPKPKQPSTAPVPSSTRTSSAQQQGFQGRNTNRNAVRERQSRLVEQQLEQAAKRAADQEAEEAAKLEHAAKSRKTTGDISSAKERYLQRKREAAAAAAAGKQA